MMRICALYARAWAPLKFYENLKITLKPFDFQGVDGRRSILNWTPRFYYADFDHF